MTIVIIRVIILTIITIIIIIVVIIIIIIIDKNAKWWNMKKLNSRERRLFPQGGHLPFISSRVPGPLGLSRASLWGEKLSS